jgi:hydrogenase maturation factor
MSQYSPIEPKLETILPLGSYCEPDEHGRCITCSDEALPLKVVEVDDLGWTAVVQMDGHPAEIDISLVEDVEIGTVVMVHGGVALEIVGSNR